MSPDAPDQTQAPIAVVVFTAANTVACHLAAFTAVRENLYAADHTPRGLILDFIKRSSAPTWARATAVP
jgi:hypothetical protein